MITHKQLIIIAITLLPLYHEFHSIEEGKETQFHTHVEMETIRLNDFVVAPVTGSLTGYSSTSLHNPYWLER